MIFSVIVLLWPVTGLAQSSTTDHFRSKVTGNWNTPATWETSSDGLDPWITATASPSNQSSSITIREGHIVTVNSNVTADQLTVLQGGSIILASNGTFNLSNGSGTDLTNYGTVDLSKNINMNLGSEVRNMSGSNFIKRINSTTYAINQCLWEDGSQLKLIIEATTSLTILLEQNFYNVILEYISPSTNQLYLSLNGNFQIRGDLIIDSKNNVASNPIAKEIWIASSLPAVNILGNISLFNKVYLELNENTSVLNLNLGGDLNLMARSRFNPGNNNSIYLDGDIYLQDVNCGINFSTSDQGGNIIMTNALAEHIISDCSKINRVNYILEPDIKLTSNNFQVTPGYSLTIKNNASLNINSTVAATVERSVSNADWLVPLDGWHILSSPVANQAVTAGGFTYPDTDPNYSKYDFYSWDEPQNLWLNYKVTSNPSNFVPGTGYFVAYDEGGIKTFTGNLNVSNVQKNNLSFTGSSPYAGFHLLGNPFQASLDWSHSGWARNNVGEVAHVWNEEAMNYLQVTSANPYIAPNQGFFVQVTDPVNSLTIPSAARCHHSGSFYKQAGNAVNSSGHPDGLSSENTEENVLWLKVQGKTTTPWDETMVRLCGNAEAGYDLLDGHKLTGSELSPQLYTAISDEESLSVNSLPVTGYPAMMPLYFSRGADTDYRLSVLENTMQKEIWLEDTRSGNFTLLTRDSYFDFSSDSITVTSGYTRSGTRTVPTPFYHARNRETTARFVLHMGPLSLQEDQVNEFHIYSFDNKIYIRDLAGGANAFDYRLLNLAGRTLREGKSSGKTLTVIDIQECPPGVFVISVTGRNHSMSQKIFLR